MGVYEVLGKITGLRPKWGILTGIRPVKRYHMLESEGKTPAQIRDYFRNKLLVSEEKVRLLGKTAKSEDAIIARSGPKSFSLYVGIPFCPSRCYYCSFVSQTVASSGKLIPEYLRLLCEEIRYTGKIAEKLGLRLETVYIGGGTPTTLSADQLTVLMEAIRESFDTARAEEYTVEAGRPDTITLEKLLAIKNGGATRISVNPQTMNDEVLQQIGRQHTAAQAAESFALAREAGFDNINMDVIAGLASDTPEGFSHTIDTLARLQPENITVHTLSVKRAASLRIEGRATYDAQGKEVSEMLSYAQRALESGGWQPYYMYRQKNTLGNLENVGYAKPGFEGLYNVYIMDETHTILAVGAGATTKMRQPGGSRIDRVFNYKYPAEYIRGFGTMLARKDEVIAFYEQYGCV
ncbi:MAG: coproporphyrinogen dehydrogenase HemZ [Oscillospiraceae bacterium]